MMTNVEWNHIKDLADKAIDSGNNFTMSIYDGNCTVSIYMQDFDDEEDELLDDAKETQAKLDALADRLSKYVDGLVTAEDSEDDFEALYHDHANWFDLFE